MQSEWLPLSHAQRRLWLLDQLDPGAPAYNLSSVLRLRGELEVEALRQSLGLVLQRHAPLRTVFGNIEGEPVQAIKSEVPVELPVVDVSSVPSECRQDRALELAAEEGARPFHLETGPVIRFKLFRLDEQEHILVTTMHHIVTDGWSLQIFFRDLATFYDALIVGKQPDLPPLPVQYGDYVLAEHERLSGGALERGLQFWKETLKDAPPVLDLPADRPRPALQTHKGQTVFFTLDAELEAGVKQMCRQRGVTLFMVLLAAFDALLWRYTGASDIVVGSASAGRTELELEPLIGLFVNTVVLRAKVADDPTFLELLQRVRLGTLDTLAYQDIPFEALVQELHPARSMDNTPVFQVMFIVQNLPGGKLSLAGLELQTLEFDSGIAKFDLTLEVFDGEALFCRLEYNSDIFDRPRIERLKEHFEILLRSCLQNPERRISELELLSARERNTLLHDWSGPQDSYPNTATLHSLFEAQADRTPDATALSGAGGRLTFAQLESASNRVAHYLADLGAKPGDRIGVCMERSAQTVIAALGVLKTGAAYVPIDPHYPEDRVQFMVRDCGARILITQQAVADRIGKFSADLVVLDRDSQALSGFSSARPSVPLDSNQTAYVMYTSGSTGTPKGVMGTHKATVNRFTWMYRKYPFEPGEMCAQKTSLSFIDSIWETFGPLGAGVTLHILSDEQAKDTELLIRALAAARISRLVIVPSLLRSILDISSDPASDLSSLRFIFSSGEPLPLELFERCRRELPSVRLVNLYGSSEVAGDVTYFDSKEGQALGSVPIGRPISNTQVYIVDQRLKLVPLGVPGELLVAGDCVSRGYLNREDLTAERFIADPFRNGDGRAFRTGDLARYREDGEIEYLGRSDRQVKVRGIRIEPEEIEFVLSQYPAVQQSVVVVRGEPGHERLVAFVVPASGQTIVTSELQKWMRNKLPEHMVPAAFVPLASIPLTPNGKVDRAALPSDEVNAQRGSTFVAPRDETEQTIAGIWSEVLHVEKVGAYDHFFELGGHSLLGAQVISRLRRSFQVDIPLRALFEEPTVAGLAVAVEKAKASGAVIRTPLIVPPRTNPVRNKLAARLKDLSDEEVDALLQSLMAERSKAGV
jgi:amino acid adenylation domain-containing protein